MRKFYIFLISLFFLHFSIHAQDNLTITKTITTIPLKPGDAIVYQINYSNLNTSATANNIVIKDFLPSADLLTYVSSTSGGVYDASTRTITWSGLSLAASTSGSLTVSGICGKLSGPTGLYDPASYYISNGSSTQSIINNASIQNPTISSPVYINTPVSTSVQQYCGSSMPSGLTGYIKSATNSEIYYLITLTNAGNITDKFTLSSNNPGTKIPIPSFIETVTGSTLTQTPYITPGGTYSFKVRFKTPTGTSPDTVNNTLITATSFVCGTTATTNITTYIYGGQIPSGTSCDLQITKTASANPAQIGTNFVYTITVVNNAATHDASNVLIIDNLPTSVSIVSWTGSSGISVTNPSANQIRASKNTQKNSDAPIVVTITVQPNCAAVPSITNYAVVSSSTPDSVASNDEVYVSTNVNSTIASPTVNGTTICSGNTASLTASGSVTNPGYKWYSATAGGSVLCTGNPYPTPALTATTTYYVSTYDLSNTACESNRTSVTVTVLSTPVITSQPSNTAICPGNNTSFSIVSSGTSLSYQWQVNTGSGFTNLTNVVPYSGALSATLTITAATTGMNAYQFRCLVQTGTCTPPVNSTSATLTINTPPAITGQPSSATVCSGQSQTFTVTATGTSLTYQWRKGGVNISGATSSSYNIASVNTSDAGSYDVVVNGTCSPSVTSTSVTLTVNTLPSITGQPTPATLCSGQSQTFNVTATGTALTYQWRKGGVNISGAASSSYNIASVTTGDAGSYDVVVSGTCSPSVTSTLVTLTVNTSPSITGQPTSATLCSGQSQTFTFTASGAGLTYQWRKAGVNISGATSSSYNIATVSTGDAGSYDVVVSGTCSSSVTSTAAILLVNTSPAITTNPGSQTICNGNAVSFSVIASAGNGSGIMYQWKKNGTDISGANTSSYSIASSTLNDAGNYTVAVTSCSTTITSAIAVLSVSATGTWLGVNTNWNDAQNWCGEVVPGSTTDVMIPVTGSNLYPIAVSTTGSCRNITIAGTASLILNNGTMQIAGTISNSGTFDAANGTVEMNGSSAQTIPANAFLNNSLKNLIVSNTSTAGVTLGGALDIYGSLTYSGTGKKLITNDTLTLKSTAANTARVGDMTGNVIVGKVTVERYNSAHKAWRFLSIPTNTSQTVQQTWQEGCGANLNCVANFGTQITGSGGTAAGFDVYTATPSMKTYNPATNGWDGIANTNTVSIKATYGYMVFIRGDRTATAFNSTPTQTVLRTKGVLYTGDQAPIPVSANMFAAIGNPYPSALDMRNITKTGLKDFFYLWDPQLAGYYGYGGYQTFSNNGSGNYVITPGMGSYGTSGNVCNYITSGQAFFVQADSIGGSLTFTEGAKSSASDLVSVAAAVPQPQLRVNLYGIYADNSTYMADGLLINYDDSYSNSVDDLDAIKSVNTSENLSVKTANTLLVVERRHTIVQKDTIFLNLANTKAQQYRFEFTADQLYQRGLTGFLEDNYLHTSTPLNIDGSTIVDFNIVNIAGSYAPNRFRIVFSQLSALPVKFTSVKAYSQGSNISIEWKVDNEINMKQYEVEKSGNGNQFTNLAVTAATGNGGHSASYQLTDAHPVEGYNYYRIKSVDLDGTTAYTNVVKVLLGKSSQEITVYPNPVINGSINLQLNNQPAGEYSIRLLNKSGQVIMTTKVQHAEGSSSETIQLDKYAAHGIYQLEVNKPDGTQTNINVIY